MLLKDKIPFSYIFRKIRYELAFMVGYSVVVYLLHSTLEHFRISIPLSVPAILGTVISLLLGFRSNQAYDRWWEARHVWGAIVNDSRTLTRQLLSFVEKEYEEDDIAQFKDHMVKRQIAWTYSLGQALRGKSATQGLDRLIGKGEAGALTPYNNVPAAILTMHGRDLNRALSKGWINRYQQIELDKTLTRLCDAQGKCERIKNTVFPVTYSLYIHFSLLVFIALLPFGLMEHLGVFVIPAVAALSACFLLIEKMAIHLQDPFDNKPTDTPVTTIAKSIETDLRQMVTDNPAAEIVTPKIKEDTGFFIM
ncbi:MAG: bestrophin family ion channel [Bacteroidota bacterium]